MYIAKAKSITANEFVCNIIALVYYNFTSTQFKT